MKTSVVTHNPNETRISITALSIAMAFMRALDTHYLYLFNELELKLIKHFFYSGKASMPFSANWALVSGISILPYALQQSFFNNIAVVPGYDQIVMLRKLMIRNKIDQAIQAGTKQIVFLGGGYDIRALVASMANPQIQFYELDRGSTRASKLNALSELPKEFDLNFIAREISEKLTRVNDNLSYIECDLIEDNLLETLQKNGFRPQFKTLVIAEGLTTYLSKENNGKLLQSLFQFLKEEDELLLSYMTQIASSVVADASIKAAGEAYLFTLPLKNVIEFVGQCHFAVTKRFVSTHLLDDLGEETAADYYRHGPEKPEEYYLLLKKSTDKCLQKQNLADVPAIELSLPDKPAEFPEPPDSPNMSLYF